MTSLNSPPTRLKLGNVGFEPQVSFPVYEIDVSQGNLPQNKQRVVAGFLRELEKLDIPYQGQEDDSSATSQQSGFLPKYVFKPVQSSSSRKMLFT